MEGGADASRQPFSEHIRELRQRALYSVIALLLGSSAGYALHDKLFAIVRQPLHQKLYYTSPVAGFNAMLKLSILFGLVLALPVIMYQLCRFLEPLFRKRIKPLRVIFYSVILAATGVSFAYYVSLPGAIHFLTNVDTNNLQSFIVVNDYLNFVFSYLAGFAVLFQLPLVLLLINRIKPQSPRRLMSYERYVIIGSAVIAAILTPTPDPVNQLIMAAPLVLLYQFSVVLVWLANRRAKPASATVHKKSVHTAKTPEPTEPRRTTRAGTLAVKAMLHKPVQPKPVMDILAAKPLPPVNKHRPRSTSTRYAMPRPAYTIRPSFRQTVQPRLISDIL